MTLHVSELQADLPFGRVVVGLTQRALGNPSVREELRDLWAQHGLIVFREVNPTREFQVELSKVFGELELYPVKELQADGNPYVMRSVSDRLTESVYEIKGQEAIGWLPWHFDLAWKRDINRGGVLRAVEITSSGGQTGFIDRATAYDLLKPDIKNKVVGQRIVYRMQADFEKLPFAECVKVITLGRTQASLQAREDDFAPVSHPIVFEHADSGKKILNVSPLFSEHVEGHNDAIGRDLLEALVEHIQSCPAYFHSWEEDQMLAWDNWRMLHSVTAVPADEIRIVERTTISGDYALGREASPERP